MSLISIAEKVRGFYAIHTAKYLEAVRTGGLAESLARYVGNTTNTIDSLLDSLFFHLE